MKPLITFYRKKDNKVVKYKTRVKRRIAYRIRACKKADFYKIRVFYKKGLDNESAWYTNKKDLLYALNAFTEKDLLKDIESYEKN